MTAVLLVDDDLPFRTTLARALSGSGYDVDVAEDVDGALAALARGRFDVLLTDLRLGGRDGIDLLAGARGVSPDTRPVLMSAYATARDHQTAMELGAVKVLCKPFTPGDLLCAIQEAVECGVGFHGNVHGLSLSDMLQMFHYARRSLTVEVGGPVCGRIHVHDGQVRHAEAVRAGLAALEGEPALRALLASRAGSLRTTVLSGHERRTIERALPELLIDALRVLDEQDAGLLSETALTSPSDGDADDALADARRAWLAARGQLGPVVAPDLVLALRLRGSEAQVVHGDAAAVAWSAPLLGLLIGLQAHLDALGEGPACGLAELLGPSHALGWVWDTARGYALALTANLGERRGAPWFRSQLAALARAVGVDRRGSSEHM